MRASDSERGAANAWETVMCNVVSIGKEWVTACTTRDDDAQMAARSARASRFQSRARLRRLVVAPFLLPQHRTPPTVRPPAPPTHHLPLLFLRQHISLLHLALRVRIG